jgi:tRNA-2-methylthio-N6-dimethylallyladenosine synthase
LTKKLYVRTYGCQMNVYDFERMEEALAALGYESVTEPRGADMIILNTCHIREKAAEKVFSDLGRLRAFKEEKQTGGEDMILAVAGCVAQAEGAEIMRRAPQVDMVFGPQTYHRLPELVARAERAAENNAAEDGKRNKRAKSQRILDTEFPIDSKFDFLTEERKVQGVSAFLAIQEGCDKFCSFCVVPYTRGAEFSRPLADLLTEGRALVAAGAREITLLGQNVNAYHGEGPNGRAINLARLIREFAALEGLKRIRYTTSHPLDMDDDLIAAHGEVPQLMPYLHLPVQSGSDRVLEAMNRRHSAADYLRIVEKLRKARPDLALSSDFIVGFPGESDADFAQTIALVNEVDFAQAYSFKYSARPGTPAALAATQVPDETKADRLAALQQLLNAQKERFNRKQLGKVLPVLFERAGRRPGQLVGRSPYNQAVFAEGAALEVGQIAEIEISTVEPNSLGGRPGRIADRSRPEPEFAA